MDYILSDPRGAPAAFQYAFEFMEIENGGWQTRDWRKDNQSTLLAVLFLGETIGAAMIAGTAVILSGLFLVTGASESPGKSEGQREDRAHLH